MASHASTSQSPYLSHTHATRKLHTLSVSSVRVRASWDTQQRPSYNPNAPRKLKKNTNTLTHTSTAKASPPLASTALNTRTEQYISDLLKRNTPEPTQGNIAEQEETYLGYEQWLPSPPKVVKPRSVFNAASLAYIGDCIYELYARRHFLFPALSIEEYNDRVMAVVRCEAQDALLQKLLNSNFLSDQERDVLRWGKNINSSKTRTKKRAGAAVYNRASSLETLVGYLYLTNVIRLEKLMLELGFSIDSSIRFNVEEAIDALLQKLLNSNFLSDQERDVLRWGKNINSSKTRTKKRAGAAVYNRASSLETLVGYLYLTNVIRLEKLMLELGFSIDSSIRFNVEEAIDALLQKLLNSNFLSDQERDVLRWGKNINSSKTRTKKRAGAAVYNRASSLETLVGYLYLTNVIRLEKLMLELGFSIDSSIRFNVEEAIDALLQKLLNSNFLSDQERDVLRWGKNINSSKTRTKKRAGAAVYNRASSLETLVGYLYLTNVIRLEKLMLELGFSIDSSIRFNVEEAIDALLQKLLNSNFLSDQERDVLRWGKNINSSKTRTKKRAGAAVYNRASSLETLVGYLYLTNVIRLEKLMLELGFSIDSSIRFNVEEAITGKL